MPRIKDEDISRVRQKADIAEVIGKYLTLQKRGRNYAAICPFHNDHDPSLYISTDKQIYKCFVCGNGGNVFTFVQNYEKISFAEAVLKVADMVGEPLDYARESFQYEKYDDETKRYFKIFNEAIDFLSYQLYSSGATDVLQYLHERGYDDALIKKFHIGYNPDKNSLYRFLKAKGYTEKDMVKINLIRSVPDGFADVFSRRIIFPIFNSDNQPIAFNGRASKPNQDPKYVNSENTVLYTKGDVLYNYYAAKNAVKDNRNIYVVEGVTDVYAFERIGISNVVATLGTAMSKAQIQLLRNLHCDIILCYDGDSAGQNADLKNAKQLFNERLNVRIVRNDTGLDPDEIIKERGMDYFREMITHQEEYIEFFMRAFSRNVDFNNYSQRKSYAERVVNEISLLKDEFDKENFLLKLSQISGFEKSQLLSLQSAVQQTEVTDRNLQKPVAKKVLSGKIRTEYEIICQLLSSKQAASYFKEKLGFLPSENTNRCAMAILDYYLQNDKMEIADLLDKVDEDLKPLVIELADDPVFMHEYNEQALDESFSRIRIQMVDESIRSVKRQLAQTTDSMKKSELETKYSSLIRQKNDLLKRV